MRVGTQRLARTLCVLSVAAGLAGCGPPLGDSEDAGASNARVAPGFQLEDLDGETISLEALRGKTVLVDFWATWCAPCVHQIPILNRFQAAHPGDDVQVFGISVDVEGREIVAPFVAEHEVEYSILLGSESLARAYGAIGFPSLFVIAPDGTIESVHMGVAHFEDLEEAVARIRGGVGES